MSTPNTAPNATPAQPASTLALTPVASKFEAKGSTKEEFILSVIRALIAEGLMQPAVSKPTKDGKGGQKPYLKFNIGTIPTRFGGLLMKLDSAQALSINTSQGVPLLADFSVALLDLTNRAALAARIAEREVQTATREANRAASTSTDVLLEELRKRGVSIDIK